MIECVITKRFTFEASHVLPKHKGKCSRLHGHSWVLHVSVLGEVDKETGFVVDYGDLKELVDREIITRLDHTHLGQSGCTVGWGGSFIPYDSDTPAFGTSFYPSSENLVVAIGKMLVPLIKELCNGVRLFEVRLEETCTSAASWRPSRNGD